MKVTIDANITPSRAMLIEDALKAIAENLTAENIIFLATQSKKTKVNEKLASKKGLINSFL